MPAAMTTRSAMTFALLIFVVAGAGIWILSEFLEMSGGGRTTTTRWLTIGMHVLLGIGVWGVHQCHGEDSNRLSRIATGIMSIGYLGFAIPLTMAVTNDALSMPELAREHPIFLLAGILATIGASAVGALIIVRRRLPLWAGGVLLIFPWLMLFIHASSLPLIATNLISIAQALAWISIATAAIRSATPS